MRTPLLRLLRPALLTAAPVALGLTVGSCDLAHIRPLTMAAALVAPPGTSTGVVGEVVMHLDLDAEDHVRIDVDIEGLAPGEHGLHVHTEGSCEPGDIDGDGTPDAAGAAGGHYDPRSSPHGAPTNDPDDKHWGDLGNVTADASGVVRQTLTNDHFDQDDFEIGDDAYLIGRAVIITANRDDYTTQPDGASGARIGCGILAIPPEG